MKITVLISVFLMLTFSACYAQNSFVVQEKTNENTDTVVQLKLFTVKYNSGKNYIHWIIEKGYVDGFYAVYRSGDGIHFELIQSVRGIGVVACMDVSHYVIDDCPNQGNNYYKLLYIVEGHSFFSSEIIRIEL